LIEVVTISGAKKAIRLEDINSFAPDVAFCDIFMNDRTKIRCVNRYATDYHEEIDHTATKIVYKRYTSILDMIDKGKGPISFGKKDINSNYKRGHAHR